MKYGLDSIHADYFHLAGLPGILDGTCYAYRAGSVAAQIAAQIRIRFDNSRSLLAGSLDFVIVNATVHNSYAGILPQYSHLCFVSFLVIGCRGISLHDGHFASVANQLGETLRRNDPLLGKVVAHAGDAAVWRWRVEKDHRNTLIPDALERRHMAYRVDRIYGDATRATPGGLFQDRVLLGDVSDRWRHIVDHNPDTKLTAQDFGLG